MLDVRDQQREKSRRRAARHNAVPHEILGILIHSAVDGIAMGAISVTSNTSLELVVFLAMILHKMPAAIGVTSLLLKKKDKTNAEINLQLFYFCASAPLTAFITYALFTTSILFSWTSSASGPLSPSALGLCLLFSGGTFLFTIAAHVMPELQQHHDGATNATPRPHHGHHHSHGGAGSAAILEGESDFEGEQHDTASGNTESVALEWPYLLCLIAGIIAPFFLSHGHTHSH